MNSRKVFTAAWLGVLIISGTAIAQVECTSGVATKLKLPFVRTHAPCGYQARNADESLFWGPACSSAATGIKRCADSGQACEMDSECARSTCYDNASSEGVSGCDSQPDCGPCDGHESCGGGTCQDSSTQACVAADDLYDTPYQFGPKGACTLSAKTKIVKDCASVENESGTTIGLPAGACQMTYLSAKCKDILRADGTTPIDAPDDNGFTLRVQTRLTIDGDTILDLPLRFTFPGPLDGSMALKQNTAEPLARMFGAAHAALPPCTTMQILKAEILDSDDRPFAVAGLATR